MIVYDFALWVGMGATLGMWRVARSVPSRQAGAWVNAALFVLVFTLIGARLFYALVNHAYFSAHLIEVPQFWLGGLAWPGAMAGAWLALIYLALVSRSSSSRSARQGKSPISWVSDRLYPLLPPLAITTWIACWEAGVAYGPPLPPGTWYSVPSLDASGVYNPHWPLQPAAAISLLIYFWFLEQHVKPLSPPGKLSGLAVLGLLVNLLLASLLRADPAPSWNGLRLETWAAVTYLGFLLVFVLTNALLTRHWKKQAYNTSSRPKQNPS